MIEEINDHLSLHPDNYFRDSLYRSHKWDGYVHFLDHRGNRFPTGLINEVIKVLGENSKVKVIDETKWFDCSLPDHLSYGDKNLRDYQLDAVKTSLNCHFGIINASVNAGKSTIATAIIDQLMRKVSDDRIIIFFVHNKEIYDQTINYLSSDLSIPIGEVNSKKWNPSKVTVAMLPTVSSHLQKPDRKSVSLTGNYKSLDHILSLINSKSTYPQLKKFIDFYQNKKGKVFQDTVDTFTDIIAHHKDIKSEVKKMKNNLDKYFDKRLSKEIARYNQAKQFLDSAICFVMDEEQHAAAKSFYNVLMNCPAPYRFGLSGTIDKDNELNYFYQQACVGPIIYEVSNDYLIKHGYSAKPTVYFERIDKPLIGNDLTWQQAYELGIEKNRYRNNKIINRVLSCYEQGKSCLIIVNRIAHGKLLNDALHQKGVNSAFTNGKLSDEDRSSLLNSMRDGSLRVLIATSILDEGVNVSGINCVFIASGGKSYRQVIQRVGRGLRKDKDKNTVEIYDYLDYINEYLTKHTFERFGYYKSEKFTIKYAR